MLKSLQSPFQVTLRSAIRARRARCIRKRKILPRTSYIVLRDLPALWEMVSVPEYAVSRAVRQEEARFSG